MGRLDNAALTAISLGAPASSLMVEFSFGLAIGVNALLSKKLGEKDKKGVQKVVGQGFLLTALLYLIFLLAGIFASEVFFRLQTSDKEIIRLGKEYTSIVMFFFIRSYASVPYRTPSFGNRPHPVFNGGFTHRSRHKYNPRPDSDFWLAWTSCGESSGK